MKALTIILLLFLGCIAGYLLLLIVSALCVNPRRNYRKDSRFYRALLYSATAICLRLMRIHLQVEGLEKIPAEGRFVVVGNHRSNFDPIITWQLLRRNQLAFLSKEANFHIPIFGRIIRRCCFMAIDREDARKALVTVNQSIDLLQNDAVSIAVYPEGTRSKQGVLLPFHNSVFRIPQRAGVPLVVLTMQGTEKIHTNFPWRASTVRVRICEVIPPEEMAGRHTSEIGNRVRATMLDSLEEENAWQATNLIQDRPMRKAE